MRNSLQRVRERRSQFYVDLDQVARNKEEQYNIKLNQVLKNKKANIKSSLNVIQKHEMRRQEALNKYQEKERAKQK